MFPKAQFSDFINIGHNSRFTAVDERLAAIRIKEKYLYISLICAHAPSEDKDDTPRMPFTTNSKFCITDAPDPI